MSMPSVLWNKFAKSKRYRDEFVAAQVKRLIPLQIRKLLKQHDMSQETLAERAGLTQGVVSRAANPEYGNLTINTLVRIAAGFDVAFVGRFVPFTELDRLLNEFSDESLQVETFEEEDRQATRRQPATAASQAVVTRENVIQIDNPCEWRRRGAGAIAEETGTGQKVPRIPAMSATAMTMMEQRQA